MTVALRHMLLQDKWGNTALSRACACGHVETARVLLDHGANVDYQNKVAKLSLILKLHENVH